MNIPPAGLKVIILCGIPGSGKSTYANSLKDQDPSHTTIVSADSYFTDDQGGYNFDFTKLRQAHSHCLNLFIMALEDPTSTCIIVDNNNATNWERSPYVALAQLYNWQVEFHMMDAHPEQALERQVHGVPAEVVWRRYFEMEQPKPFWGETYDVTWDEELSSFVVVS